MSDFIRRLCLNFQCVNLGFHQVAESVVHEPMPLDQRFSGKGVRHDADVKVPFAVLRTGMAGMQVALVLDQQIIGTECCSETFRDVLLTITPQGNTYLNGLTTTRAYTPAAA